MPETPNSNAPQSGTFTSPNVLFVDVNEKDTVQGEPKTRTPDQVLRWMRSRLKYYGVPLPENYIPPPGIDLESLLKQVPWPPVT